MAKSWRSSVRKRKCRPFWSWSFKDKLPVDDDNPQYSGSITPKLSNHLSTISYQQSSCFDGSRCLKTPQIHMVPMVDIPGNQPGGLFNKQNEITLQLTINQPSSTNSPRLRSMISIQAGAGLGAEWLERQWGRLVVMSLANDSCIYQQKNVME